jgi:hypothetical protein
VVYGGADAGLDGARLGSLVRGDRRDMGVLVAATTPRTPDIEQNNGTAERR